MNTLFTDWRNEMNVQQLELNEMWSETDEERGVRVNFPISLETGSASTTVVYFEVPPHKHLGMHTDSAEEILYIVAGSGEAIVGDERVEVEAGSLALIPSMVPHDVVNTGDEPIRVVGFFSSATVLSTFEEPFAPLDANVLLSPPALAPAKLEPVAA
jgi:quercetin dioxygenase-like cupin family protein